MTEPDIGFRRGPFRDGSLLQRTDDGRRVALPADYLEHARHGYVITGHASQGATVDRTFRLASPERGSAEWGYVVGSRHRIESRVYVAGGNRDLARDELAPAWARTQGSGLAVDRLGTLQRGSYDREAAQRQQTRESSDRERSSNDLGLEP